MTCVHRADRRAGIGSLFSGYSGLDMAVMDVLGGSVAWHSDIDPGACKILAHHWPDVPNLGDVSAVDWTSVEPVDVLTGGFPCQDVSHAGNRAGLRPGTRSGLWTQMAYAISQLRPPVVVIENVRGLLSAPAASDVEPCPWCLGDSGDESALRALGAVLGDLADLGYDARWSGVRASDVGAPHQRFRVFIVAHPADTNLPRPQGRNLHTERADEQSARAHGVEPALLKTPTSQLAVNGGSQHPDKRKAGGHGPTLADEVEHLLPTPERWGNYAAAIARWESALGRAAPTATESGRLSPLFVEWLMGLPAGHVTDPAIGLTRPQQLKALGNGVVPQQAAYALRLLLTPDLAKGPNR